MTVKKFLMAATVAAATVAAAASAAPVQWTFNNATFFNGAAVTGGFTYDSATNLYSDVDVLVGYGLGTFPMSHTLRFTHIAPGGLWNSSTTAFFLPESYDGSSLDGWEFLYMAMGSPLTDAGGTIDFAESSLLRAYCIDPICNNYGLDFVISTAGNPNMSIEGTPLSVGAVPEPSSWAMLIAGFGMIGAMARRRRLKAA